MEDSNFISLKNYVEALFRQYAESHAREHELQAESIQLARQNMEYRLEGLNKWREQLQAERGQFVSSDKFDATMEASERRLNTLDRQVSNLLGRMVGIGAAITVALAILEIALRFLVK